MTTERMYLLLERYPLPLPKIAVHYSQVQQTRFFEEPDAAILHVRICGGRRGLSPAPTRVDKKDGRSPGTDAPLWFVRVSSARPLGERDSWMWNHGTVLGDALKEGLEDLAYFAARFVDSERSTHELQLSSAVCPIGDGEIYSGTLIETARGLQIVRSTTDPRVLIACAGTVVP